MGDALIAWAMMMVVGVLMIFKNPEGPERQRKIETQSPATTGGNPIPALIKDKK